MRILRIYPTIPPMPGGMEKHILRLTEEQRRLGCEVSVIFNRGKNSSPADIRVLAWANISKFKPQALRDFIFYTAVIIKVVFARVGSEVIHIHGDWSAFFFGKMIAMLVRARVRTASIHDVVKKTKFFAFVYKYSLHGYDVVYCTGLGDAAYLNKIGISNARYQNSGIDRVFFNKNRTNKKPEIDVVCVANMVSKKNLDLVLDIAVQLPHLRFELIGEGVQRRLLEERCEREHISNIRFAGRLSSFDVVCRLHNAKIFLSTSFTEGTPTALLEAMACGLPIVTSNSNDYSEIISEGVNGFVVPGFDSNKYVEIIKKIIRDDDLQCVMAKSNLLAAKRHSWPLVARRITDWMSFQECP